MITIKGPSDAPCFICGNKEKTADVSFADKTFRGVLCLDDIYKKLKPEVPHVHREGGGGETPPKPQQSVRAAG